MHELNILLTTIEKTDTALLPVSKSLDTILASQVLYTSSFARHALCYR